MGSVTDSASGESLLKLRQLMCSLSDEQCVYGASDRVPDGGGTPALRIAAEAMRRLVRRVDKEWAHYVYAGTAPLPTLEQTEASLDEVTEPRAVELLVRFSVRDLMLGEAAWRDEDRAREDVRAVAALLGPEAVWFTNHEAWGDGTGSWNAVTRQTFDGVVAGVGGGLVAVLLQVGED